MSCDIHWDAFEQTAFQTWSKELLYDSLNSGKRPQILSSDIRVTDLNFGNTPPSFEVLEVGDLDTDKFRGIFKLKYDGDSSITLSTNIQANLLKIQERVVHEQGGDFALPKFTLASQPFSIPLFLKLSNIRLSGIIVVVFSKVKGLTLVFKNDPLENIKVSSSFDNVQVIEKFLQNKIENQIRDLFRDILPGVLHKVSQRWTTSNIISQLHTKMQEHPVDGERVSIFEVNPEEPELSPANMLRLSTLNRSRQSFRLSVPPFPDVIERPALSKFDAQLTLGKSKNIPIDVITNNTGYQLDDTLSRLTKIQTKNFLNEKNSVPVKRRSLKLGKKKSSKTKASPVKSPQPPTQPQATLDLDTPLSSEQMRTVSMNTDATLVNEDQGNSFIENDTVSAPSSTSHSIHMEDLKRQAHLKLYTHAPSPVTPSLSPMLEKIPLLQRPPLAPMKTDLRGLYTPSSRSHSPRKSQSNLLSVGIGLQNSVWGDAPPPYTHI